ncbi:MAG: hypothetical protein ACYDC1_21970, partial [Limisphaerales bacterium]
MEPPAAPTPDPVAALPPLPVVTGAPVPFPSFHPDAPHLVGWSAKGEPIYRGTQRQFEEAID